MLAAAGVLALGLAACSSDDAEDAAAGTPFTQALAKDYGDLSAQAAALPAEPAEEGGFFSSLNPFSDSSTVPATCSPRLSPPRRTWPMPAPSRMPKPATARPRPPCAPASCAPWPPARTSSPNRPPAPRPIMIAGSCTAPCPAPPPPRRPARRRWIPRSCAWKPRPVRRRPCRSRPRLAPMAAPAPAPAPASSDFTVYFDFDSWTLKAEQLTVLDL